MFLPLQFLVAPGAENIDVGLGLLAEPNFRTLDGSDDARGEIDGSAKDIALFDLQRTDVNAGPQPELLRSRISAERSGVVERRRHGAKRGHDTVANRADLVALVTGGQLSALCEMSLSN